MGLAGENLDAVHHHQRHRQEGGADPPSFCGILSIRPQNAGWKEHGSIRPARAADSHADNLSDGKSFVCLMPYGLDYSTILIMIVISYDVALSSFLSLRLPATLATTSSSVVVPRSPSTNRSPNGAAVPSSKRSPTGSSAEAVLSLPLLDVTPSGHPRLHCRKELDAVAHWRSPSWVWVGGAEGTGPGPKSEAFRVSNRRVIPISIQPREQLSSCYIRLDTARHETNTSVWVDPHRLQMGRFPTDRTNDSGSSKYLQRGLGIDSVLGQFRRGTKGRIPTWSASWRPFCRVADFLSLSHSLTLSLFFASSIDGVRTSSN
ncbi:hypothetical protein BO85DRAFT_472538 [Aspergillus piperis CBS 112811]|uniref:Uncharacterized protein n=1 Tax=Aspergillus piperis CBS 112811 TaxID=1448313 RepID=A0A8G1QTZ2_9EURO|nr:hypothetical protein BO85DRAFT_472538 [Aspergillus piperis CBS 112811]RAH52529.1 hypothetical protein BO85DRAFT_472538 [Aspergillus piperis CBS 112811]